MISTPAQKSTANFSCKIKIFLTLHCLSWSCLKAKFSAKLVQLFWQGFSTTEHAFISPDISFDWWSGYVTGEADPHCKAAELPATRRSSPRHSNLHRILVCSEHSNGIQFHLLQNKIYSPGPTQPWRQWHPEQKLPWVEISLNFTYYAIPAMPTVFHLLIAVMITDCQPAHTIHMPLLHSSMLQVRTRTNTRAGLCLAKSCV